MYGNGMDIFDKTTIEFHVARLKEISSIAKDLQNKKRDYKIEELIKLEEESLFISNGIKNFVEQMMTKEITNDR